MIVLLLNIFLEVTSLITTWRQRIWALTGFLTYLLLFDLAGVVVTNFHLLDTSDNRYWYFYWIGRTIGMLLQSFSAVQVAVRGKTKVNSVIVYIWGCAMVTLLICAVCIFWFNSSVHLTNAAILRLCTTCCILSGMILLVALVRKPKDFPMWVGSAAWIVVTLLCSQELSYVSYYPIASLVPLLIWSSCLLRRRGELPSHLDEGYGYDTKTARSKRLAPAASSWRKDGVIGDGRVLPQRGATTTV